MALLFIDGFDHSGNATIHATKYGTQSGMAISNTNPRTGSGHASISSNSSYFQTKVLPASGAAIVGVARYMSPGASLSVLQDIIQLGEATALHLALSQAASGVLTIKRGTTVIATGTTVLVAATYYFLELKAVIHDTAGSYEVRIDGVTEAALTASGVDTRNGGTTGQWDRVTLMSNFSGAAVHFDDFYVCDGSGAIRNDFLGPVKVETLLPQTGNGSNVGLTPSTGTDHGALVDENPPNTTDYNSSATVGAKDTYHYPSLTLSGAILGVQTNLYCQKSDASARTVCAVVRAGGVDYDGAPVSPLTSWSYLSEPRALNPNTGVNWTPADIAALEAGMKVTA